MARSTGPIIALGAITLGRDVLIDNRPVDWRIPVATGITAVLFAGAEKAVGALAPGVAWIALITVIFTRSGGRPSPAEALLKVWEEGT